MSEGSLFSGQAWFSPRVPMDVRKTWAAHGGIVAGSHGDRTKPAYLFCDGNDDPWFPKLYQRSMAVFHWLWISDVVNARFRVPIAAYAIDERTTFNVDDFPTRAYSHGRARAADTPRTPHPVRDDHEHEEASDETSASHTRSYRTRKTVRIEDDTTAVDISDQHLGSSHRKRKSLPFVDLRSLQENCKRSRTRHAKSSRVATGLSRKLQAQVLPPSRKQEDLPQAADVSRSASTLGSSSRAVSVSVALQSLSYVSVQDAVQFVPGAVYQGKEFRCFYVR